ncbi:MAG: NAD-dependent epimerase/dehydratase family protein, partial [Oleiphilaceae bacterium]|nr:NAD-dependent epimerase/dehydratase family protein [Oleiphilaceae bacterium]
MHILITGGTGFIGSHLCRSLIDDHTLTILSRQSAKQVQDTCGASVRAIGSLSEIKPDEDIDAIVNLAGAPIADARWSEHRKQILLESRCDITRELVTLISDLKRKPSVFVSGSAVGYYGAQGEKEVTEGTSPVNEFTHELCAAWESCAHLAEPFTRVCYLRTGLVLGNDGGMLKKLKLPFKLGL